MTRYLSVAAVGTLAVGFLMTVRLWPGHEVPAIVGALATLYFYARAVVNGHESVRANLAQHIFVCAFVAAIPARALDLSAGLLCLLVAFAAFMVWLGTYLYHRN